MPHRTEHRANSIPSLFCLKTLCAFFIVCIHFADRSQRLYPVIRTAVPIFFLISGFFLYSPDRTTARAHIGRTFRKTVRLTLATNLFYLCFGLCCARCQQQPYEFPIRTLADLAMWLYFGNTFAWHLWYLTAYLQVLLCAGLALCWGKERWLTRWIPVGLLLNLMWGKYAFLFSLEDTAWTLFHRTAATIGLPCFWLGWLLRASESDHPEGGGIGSASDIRPYCSSGCCSAASKPQPCMPRAGSCLQAT